MKLFELAKALQALVPGAPNRADFWREFISCFTSCPFEDFASSKDPSVLPTGATLNSMSSRDSAFTKKFAQAIYARLDTDHFIDVLSELDPATQTLMLENLRKYDVEIDPDDFAFEVTCLLAKILQEKAKVKDDLTVRFRQMRIHAALARYRDLLLVRSHGCGLCGTPLEIKAHNRVTDSYQIVFLETDEEYPGPESFSVLCKPCAEKFTLSHTPEEVTHLRQENQKINEHNRIAQDLAPLHLDTQITSLLKKINNLPFNGTPVSANYSPEELKSKIVDRGLLRQCLDLMTLYENFVREEAKALENSGEFDFELMRQQIRSAWFTMRKTNISQEETFERLTKWIQDNTGEDRYACGVVVAFMIQICEVFSSTGGA